MSVGIAKIDEQCALKAVAPRPTIDGLAKSQFASHVAGAENLCRIGDRQSDMVQLRADALEQHEIVGVALAVKKHRLKGAVDLYIFRRAKPELRIKGGGF